MSHSSTSFHLFFGLPFFVPSTSKSSAFTGPLSSSILSTCPNHRNLFSHRNSSNLTTPVISRIFSLFILSFKVFQHIIRNILLSQHSPSAHHCNVFVNNMTHSMFGHFFVHITGVSPLPSYHSSKMSAQVTVIQRKKKTDWITLRFYLENKISKRILVSILETASCAKRKLYQSKQMGKYQVDKLELDGSITLRI